MPDDGVASRRPSAVQTFGGHEFGIQQPGTSHSPPPLTQSSAFSSSTRASNIERTDFAVQPTSPSLMSTSLTSLAMSTSSMNAMVSRAKSTW